MLFFIFLIFATAALFTAQNATSPCPLAKECKKAKRWREENGNMKVADSEVQTERTRNANWRTVMKEGWREGKESDYRERNIERGEGEKM